MTIYHYPIWHHHAPVPVPAPDSLTRRSTEKAPYVRVRLPGGTVDGKARAWSPDTVLVDWREDKDVPHSAWVPASWCTRISRDESRWKDVYDDLG